jgi:prolyl oligopeptidase PreP (S9A serine peptidase family)
VAPDDLGTSIATLNPAWEIILNLDELAASENENWVWKGADILQPSHDRALLFLSRGGADAAVMREFDLSRNNSSRRLRACGGEKPRGLAPSRCDLHRQRFRSRFAN